MTYNTIRNPLLDNSNIDLRQSSRFKESTYSFKSLFSHANFKFTSNKNKNAHTKVVPSSGREHRKKKSEPLVHHNGPYDTLDQLPEEKLNWISKETTDYKELRHPLLDYPKSIVLRKPHHRNQSSLGYLESKDQPLKDSKAKATFYIRVLEVINQNLSKPCLIRSSIESDEEVFSGSYVVSQKCGKNGSQATIDETFLIDVDRPSNVKLSIYAQPKTVFGSISSRFRQPEILLGSQDFKISMRPSEKKLKRVTIHNSETNEQYQVLVIYGTFVSSRVMTLLDNKMIYEGFITVYTRGKLIPRWARYWAALYPGHIELYDFEYKDKRKALYKISIKALMDVFHPPTDDDERLVDVGSLGLALQFGEESLVENDMIHSDFEYRMYILPDDHERSHEWEQALLHVVSLINEFRGDCSYIASKFYNTTKHDQNDEDEDTNLQTMGISSKFLW